MSKRGHDNYAQPLDRLASFHDWLAETVREHAPRLAAYAYTNPYGGSDLLEQTAQQARDGGFVGLIVNTSVNGRYLDEADEFWSMAAELGKPVFLHPPAEPVGTGSLADWRLVEQVARFVDVTVGLGAVVFGGVLERHPDLDVIAATAGGAASLVAARLDAAFRPPHWGKPGGPPGGGATGRGGPPAGGPPPGMPAFEDKITQAPSTFLKRVYVDTANSSVANHLGNLELMGPGRMLFGTDSPPLATPLPAAIAAVQALPIDEAQQHDILANNAKRLFGL